MLSGGARVRFVRVGSGPALLLMHTVRTQLDHFQLVIPQVTDAFTVYAVDFPGLGSIPGARYILLRDTGHFTALEAPHEVTRILRDDLVGSAETTNPT